MITISKRRACFISLLLAHFILLAHAVIPHHHHEVSGVCLFNAHYCDCKEDEHIRFGECECSDEHGCTHNMDGDSSSEMCCSVVDDAYTLSENATKGGCAVHPKCSCGHRNDLMISMTLNIRDFVDRSLLYFRHKPYIALLFSGNIPSSLGLRGPPAC